MPTLALPRQDGTPGARTRARAGGRIGPGECLLAALMILILYAAFSHGASADPAEPRLQVATAAVAALAGGVWLWGTELRARASRVAWVGVGLLAAFTVWSAISLAWSVAPDETWLEINRYVTYSVITVLAVLAGSSVSRVRERLRSGFLLIALVVAADGLGQKLLPAVHLGSILDLNQTGQVPRLQMPFGYWNALALFMVLAVPLALSVALDQTESPRRRIAGLVSLEPLFLVIAFTYSRGGLVALLAGLLVMLTVGRGGLKGLLWLVSAGAASVPPLVFGLSSHYLTAAHVSLSHRQTRGAELAVLVVATMVGLYFGGRRLLASERSVRISPARAHAIRRGLIALGVVALLVLLIGAAVSHRGLTGTVSHTWHTLTNTSTISDTNPDRLLSDKFGYRLLWWKESLRAFSARPFGGWGAGSFPVVHLLFRRNGLSVRQPHSVPLQFLAETGLVGALLALGAFAALMLAASRAVRERVAPHERLLAGALFAAAVAYAVHSCYDWDSDIPGVTLPVLVFLGVLVGSAGAAHEPAATTAGFAFLPEDGFGTRTAGKGDGLRLAAIVGLTAALCVFAASAALPSLAGQKASNAQLAAAQGQLGHADQQAAVAAKLDPLSDDGLKLQATIALRLAQRPGQHVLTQSYVRQARELIGRAIARDPSDPAAWADLVQIELLARNYPAGIAAAQRVLELDPAGEDTTPFYAAGLAQGMSLVLAPPQDSATAGPTPSGTGSGTTASTASATGSGSAAGTTGTPSTGTTGVTGTFTH